MKVTKTEGGIILLLLYLWWKSRQPKTQVTSTISYDLSQ